MGIEVLKGQVLKSVRRSDEQVVFLTKSGKEYVMYHEQDCCELVTVAEVIGDYMDLIGAPILQAEEVTYSGDESDFSKWPEGVRRPEDVDSYTWTFYKLSTIKGSVTIRWYGSSNEHDTSITFEEVER